MTAGILENLLRLKSREKRADVVPDSLSRSLWRTTSHLLTSIAWAFVSVMVFWLAFKDWLTSNTVKYPYDESFAMTAAVLVAAFGVLVVRRCDRWRDFALVAGIVGCVIFWRFSNTWPLAWSLMPGMGILLCAFNLPLPPDPKWSMSSRFSLGGARRIIYGGAFLVGATFQCFTPGTTDLDMTRLPFPIAIVVIGCMMRLSARLASSRLWAFRTLIGVYGVTTVLYCLLPLIGIDKLASWSLIGSGLRSTGTNAVLAPALIGEDGVLSLSFRIVLLISVFTFNASALLRHGKQHETTWQSNHEKEALAVSSGGVAAILIQTLASPLCPANMLASSVAGSWNTLLALAALAIGTQALVSPAEASDHVKPVNKAAVFVIACMTLITIVIGGCWLAICHVASTAISTNSLSSPAWFVPYDKIPSPVKDVVKSEKWRIQCLLQSSHDILRRACGSQAGVPPSMAGLLGFELVSDWTAPRLTKEILGEAIGSILSKELSSQRIEELYINYRNYGAPTRGLDAAAAYYFHRPLSTLTQDDARFLISCQSTMSEPLSSRVSGRISQSAPLMPSLYSFDEFPARGSIHHDGAVNNKGRAVGTAFAGSGSVAYSIKLDRQRVLGDLSDNTDTRSSFALAINDADQAVGYSLSDDGVQHAVIWSNAGAVEDLGVLSGYSQSVARSINSKGQVAGFCFNPVEKSQLMSMRNTLETPSRAFLWQDGRMTSLGAPDGYIGSRAYAINDAGQIAGWLLTADSQTHAMVWENGRMQDIGTLGGDVSIATAMNNKGQVVGSSQRPDGTVVAFMWQNGVMHDLGLLPGDDRARAWAINDSGVVVGYSFGKKVNLNGPGGRPFIWDSVHGMRDLTPMYDVNSEMKAALDHANTVFSINNEGEILGLDFIPHRPRLLFLLRPRAETLDSAQTIEADWGKMVKANVQYDSGASFSRVVGNMQFPGASVTYSGLDGGRGGQYNLAITYAVPFDSSTTLYVNGAKAIIVKFPKTSGWKGMNAYKTIRIPVFFKSGKTNSIVLRTEAGNGAVNFGKLTFTPADGSGQKPNIDNQRSLAALHTGRTPGT